MGRIRRRSGGVILIIACMDPAATRLALRAEAISGLQSLLHVSVRSGTGQCTVQRANS